MNEFAINIEYLLLSHNIVIVPTLGAFHTMHTPARWISSEDLFMPPVRNVHFDSSIISDPDSLFVKSIAEIYGLSFEEAEERCQEMVTDFHKTLVTEGTIDFGSIGIFSIEANAEITMASCECGVITPSLYGLDALHISQIVEKEEEENVNIPFVSTIEETKEQATFAPTFTTRATHRSTGASYRKLVVNYAIAVAAAIALFFVFNPTQIQDTQSVKRDASTHMFLQPNMVQQSKVVDADYLTLVEEEEMKDFDGVLVDVTEDIKNAGYNYDANSVSVKEVAKTTPTKTQVVATNATTTIAAKTAKVEQSNLNSTTQGAYCIVLASNVSEKNAENFIESLKSEGVKASVQMSGKVRRVVIGGFANDKDAYEKMHTLKQDHHRLADAWVLKL